MANDLFDGAQRILVDRLRWEERVRRYYQMSRDGLPRRDKTKSWQADGHSRTIDRAIRKARPFWFGQSNAGDRLCNFTALTQQVQTLSDSAADYYNFVSVNQSRFLDEMDRALYHMLLKGRGILLSTIDPIKGYPLVDEAIDPMFLLMPESADDFEDADEWIRVKLMTVSAYKMLDDRYDKSPETINKIKGNKEFGTLGIYQQQVQLREGITHTTNSNYILIFEHWTKTGSGHDISYYSPHAPEIEIRKTHPNPYKFQGKESIPYKSIKMEIVEKGWYAPRGLGELLDVQEQYETFIENKWCDSMTMANTRMFTGKNQILNTANIRMEDGQYIDGEIQSIQFSPPPIPYTEMLNYQKARSEEISQVPDVSRTDKAGSKTGGKAITAKEASIIASVQQAGSNYTGDIFRRDLRRIHEHRWGLIVQFKERDFSFYAASQVNTLPQQAIHDSYMISADGSTDGWNRGLRMQREIGFMQTFAPLPNSNADYWVERAMKAVDGQAGIQGFKPTGMKQNDEYEAQASEILLLTATPPFPVQPDPTQDQVTRIKCLIDWLHAAGKLGVPVDPHAKQRVFQNLTQRLQILQQQNPSAASKIKQMLVGLEQAGQASQMGNGAQRNGNLTPTQQPPTTPQ